VVPAIALLLAAAAARKTVTPGALRAGAVSLMPVGGSLLAAATGAWPVLEQLPESLAPSARTMAWVLGLLLLLAPAAGAWLARRRPAAAVLALAAPLLLLPPVASRFMVEGAEFRSSSSLARAIADGCPGAPVVGIDALPTSLPFYLGRPIGLASSTGVPFPSHYVEAHWQEITARGGGGTLFTRSWWNELPARVVVVLERSNQAKSFGAQLQGFEPLTSDRRHTAWGRGC
jgi:hypothetical protein